MLKINDKYEMIFASLPSRVTSAIKRICAARVGGVGAISELHMCVGSRSSLLLGRERIYLLTEIAQTDMQQTVNKLCNGAIYAHRDTITAGYISLDSGIRVGICGTARYELGHIVGISDVSSLVFRIPTRDSSLLSELEEAWSTSKSGMLIYARAGVGKTTALRSLVSSLAQKEGRIAVVDERCEFSVDECRKLGVTHLRGYRRYDGMEIALRTMSPDIIVVDEIGSRRESDGMLDSLNSGIRLLASAHSESADDVVKRPGVRILIENGIFDVLFGIFNTDGTYSHKIERLK
ncbi:MAG: Flp pilus assembly complex ATPase component TadA [Clostridia bacterium]|nr:Flp pilus assembly complex ATPase component TadA [Clostridia bacterium]